MKLVRQVQLRRTPFLDEITNASKNLYNVALYETRQRFLKDEYWIRYTQLWRMLKDHPCYLFLKNLCGSHPPQQVLKQVDDAWKSFFDAMKMWKSESAKFLRRPKPPSYKPKNGHNIVYFTAQQSRVTSGIIQVTKRAMNHGFPKIKTDIQHLKGVRIVPYGDRYNFDLVYEKEKIDLQLSRKNVLGIDLGITNLVTVSDNCGHEPLLIKGGIVKSVNQYYNKQLAKYKSLTKKCNNAYVSNRILRILRLRNNKIRDIFHKISRKIIKLCIQRNIGFIIIGYNEGWKYKVNIGKKTNQNFVSIPFLKLIKQIEYKGAMVGIDVVRVTEEFTSQTCSNCGLVRRANRKYRGLYICKKCGSVINADVNASINIMKKVVSESIKIGDRGCMYRPSVLLVT